MLCILLSDILSTWGYSQIAALLNLHLLGRGHSLTSIAALTSATFASSFVCSLPAGLAVDGIGPQPALLLAALLQAGAVWLQLGAATSFQLALAGLAMGAALALFTAAKTPLLATLATASRRLPATLALFRGCNSLAAVGGGLVAAWQSAASGGLVAPLLSGALLVSCAPLPLLRLKDRRRPLPVRAKQKQSKPQSALLVSFFCCSLAASLLMPYLNLLLSQRGLTPAQVSASFSAWQLAALLAWPVTVRLMSISAALPLTLAALALLAALACLPQPAATWWLLILTWQMGLSVSLNFYHGRLAAPAQARGMRFALVGMLNTAAAVAGAWLGARLLAGSQFWLLLAVSGCAATALALALLPDPR